MANILNEIAKSVSIDMARDNNIRNAIYEKVRTGDIPFLLFKSYGNSSRIQYTMAVNDVVIYLKRGRGTGINKAMLLYGSTGIALDGGNVRIAPRELQEQLVVIQDQLNALEQKKQELLKSYWSKSQKLTWQKAEDFDNMRKQYWGK